MQAALQQQRDLKKEQKPAIVESGDAWKYLQYKGRDRGYAQRAEVTGADGGPVVFHVVDEE